MTFKKTLQFLFHNKFKERRGCSDIFAKQKFNATSGQVISSGVYFFPVAFWPRLFSSPCLWCYQVRIYFKAKFPHKLRCILGTERETSHFNANDLRTGDTRVRERGKKNVSRVYRALDECCRHMCSMFWCGVSLGLWRYGFFFLPQWKSAYPDGLTRQIKSYSQG